MKKSLVRAALPAIALACLTGCQPSKPELHIYTWTDYISPDVISAFEEKHDCTVVIDTFDSNEAMYAKLKAGATGYDI
ncbi:MAG: extracellular solute-binding protein, partial [Kiritimatiellae bacterium]|nr:extracellular solute-binding protein [Kiritimatiellia bacterium]